MRRVCLAIGVGDAPNLDYLAGAVNGARAMADWARALGPDGKPRFETVLLTDEERPVRIADVKAALEGLLVGGAERLLLYFAGHGLATDAGADLWLPSDWDKTRLAISVGALRDRLLRYGLERLVIVSDACRVLLDANTRDVLGQPVLDRGQFDERRPMLDEWKAASPARAAWMIPEAGGAPARCVFSGLLMEALAGVHAEAFDIGTPAMPLTNFSLADFLEREVPKKALQYGAALAPDILTSIRPPFNRYLESRPLPPPSPPPWPNPATASPAGMGPADGSRILPPPGKSWTTAGAPALPPPPAPMPPAFKLPPASVPPTAFPPLAAPPLTYKPSWFGWIGNVLGQKRSRPTWNREMDIEAVPPPVPSRVPPQTVPPPARRTLADVKAADAAAEATRAAAQAADIDRFAASFQAEARPDHFESGAGFTISGASYAEAWLGPPGRAVPLGDSGYVRIEPGVPLAVDPWWGNGWPIQAPLPLLVRLADGRHIGAAALPRFVLSFSIGDEGADAVIYRSYDMPQAPETERMLAELRVAGLSTGQTGAVLARLRGNKHADPMLGVLAAYLHDAMGDWANVARTAYYFARRGQAVPFDIAMLGRFQAARLPNGLITVSLPAIPPDEGARGLPPWMREATPPINAQLGGAFPWLRQGWARLDSMGFEGLYPPGLAAIARHLLPAPFTTLDEAGGTALRALLWGDG